jgi:hypothetical protein
MPTDKPASDRPEAGADTEQGRRGQAPDKKPAESGGTRTPAGSDYGDFVPDRGMPPRSDDEQRNAEQEETVVEAKRNKSFDSTHVHTSTTSRKV